MLKKDNRFHYIDSSSPNSSPPNHGTIKPRSTTVPTDSLLFGAGWRSPKEFLKQAGLSISTNG